MYQGKRLESLGAPALRSVVTPIPEPAPLTRALNASPALLRYAAAVSHNGSAVANGMILQLQGRLGNRVVQRLMIQRQAGQEADVAPEVESRITQARGSGQPLERGVKTQMESVFGTDFGDVRVHTDEGAEMLNRAVGAVAFTTGQDIFFGRGGYDAHSPEGRGLLAHELTHVVQQGDAVQTKLVLGEPGDAYEQEAERVAAEVVSKTSQAGCAESPGAPCPECEAKEKQNGPGMQRLLRRTPALWLPRKSQLGLSRRLSHFSPAIIRRQQNMFDCARIGVPCPPASVFGAGICRLIGCSRAATANLPFAISPGICIFQCDDGTICTCVLVGSSSSAICTFKFCSAPGTQASTQEDFDNLAVAAVEAYQQQAPAQTDGDDSGTATA
jgi:hypothetical protein